MSHFKKVKVTVSNDLGKELDVWENPKKKVTLEANQTQEIEFEFQEDNSVVISYHPPKGAKGDIKKVTHKECKQCSSTVSSKEDYWQSIIKYTGSQIGSGVAEATTNVTVSGDEL